METSLSIKKAGAGSWLGTMDFDLGKEQRLTFTLLTPRRVGQSVTELQAALLAQLHSLAKEMDSAVPKPPTRPGKKT